jgi:Flp pilus assembly pilin Flp
MDAKDPYREVDKERDMFDRITSSLRSLHRDERGAEGLEKLLIIAAIVLPLLGLLIIFRNEIREWVVGIWGEARDKATANQDKFISDTLNP